MSRVRRTLLAAATLAALLAAAEAGLRVTGYAAPILYVADPEYEYALAPNQRTHRLSARLETNALGMRSPELSELSGPRVLVLGDSVVSGVNWTDQRALATTLLIARGYGAMNVSAGSWGPGNMLAYVHRHGLHDAQTVIIVLSAHDYFDDRAYGPLNGYSAPQIRPRIALVRAFDQYVLRGPDREAARTERPGVAGDARQSLPRLFDYLNGASADTCVVRHWTQSELAGGAAPGAAEIAALASEHDIRVVQADGVYREALARGETIFRDDIHPNDRGQALLADLMTQCLATP